MHNDTADAHTPAAADSTIDLGNPQRGDVARTIGRNRHVRRHPHPHPNRRRSRRSRTRVDRVLRPADPVGGRAHPDRRWRTHHVTRCAVIAAAVGISAAAWRYTAASPLWLAAAGWFVVRLAFAWTWRPDTPTAFERRGTRLRVGVVIPVYNESSSAVTRTLRSLKRQTREPDVVYVCDDGSTDTTTVIAAARHAGVRVWRSDSNRGKRHAQSVAFTDRTVDVWLLVDSDTTLADDAVEQMVAVMADPRVHAATSLILPRNTGVLPLLQEVEYATAMLVGRAVTSWTRKTPVISGGYSAVAAHVIRDNIDDYLAGMFGEQSGDDRHLAFLAGRTGRVVLAADARAYTDVPARLRTLVRQRVRWGRSFWVGTVYGIRYGTATQRIILTATLLSSVAATVGLGVVAGLAAAGVFPPVELVVYLALLSWVRAWRYLAVPTSAPARRYVAWLAAPVQMALSMFVLLPVHVYALLSCRRQGGWLTRGDLVGGVKSATAGQLFVHVGHQSVDVGGLLEHPDVHQVTS